ncbi:hypothetical protein [Neptuniibacter halophilus]|uniref:hypothetical protein n=1 Tax=Neptuniibacter halophilus TaxID=651666 RepID=UPI002572F385|nr:hypothetical protein [Neptuniibacter halophilus]
MKKIMLRCKPLLLCTLLAGCSYNPNGTPDNWLQSHGLQSESRETLRLCRNFGCSDRGTVRFSAEDMAQIRALFTPQSRSPEEERQRIANAIGLMETISGPQLNTVADLAKNDFALSNRSNQLDCIAESLNTSRYLLTLEQQGLLQFHRTGGNAHRGPLRLSAPHNSATIRQLSNQQGFAVDSWFRGNGEPAWVVPIEIWLSGNDPAE